MYLPRNPTGKVLYEEIWAMAHNVLVKDSRFLDKKNLWWNQKDWPQVIATREEEKGLKPFIIKMVNREGLGCSKCDWTRKCSGCIIEPSDEMIP